MRVRQVTEGYKYKKSDKAALEVPLQPGEMLLLHDDARSWVNAVTGFQASGNEAPAASCPFDFVHLSLLDMRGFERDKPREYAKLLEPPCPKPGDASYKWMQCSYKVAQAASGEGGAGPEIELQGWEA